MTRKWWLDRIGVPLLAAGWMLATRWGDDSLVYIIAVPTLLAVWRMFTHWLLRPRRPDAADMRRWERAVRNWHALDALSVFLLMFFEGAVAGMAETRVVNAAAWLGVVGFLFVPYAAASWGSAVYLRRANRMSQSGQTRES